MVGKSKRNYEAYKKLGNTVQDRINKYLIMDELEAVDRRTNSTLQHLN